MDVVIEIKDVSGEKSRIIFKNKEKEVLKKIFEYEDDNISEIFGRLELHVTVKSAEVREELTSILF